MSKHERVRYEALLRVRDFGKAHPEVFANAPYGQEALSVVAHAVEQYEAYVTARTLAAGEVRNQRARRLAILDRMRAIARTAGRVGVPSGARMRLRVPFRGSHVGVAAAARSFLEQAEARQAEFVKFGLPSSCLAELRQTLSDFEAAMSDRRLGRAGIALAGKGIERALSDGARAVLDLDVVVRNVVGHDPLIAAWERDMRIVEGRRKRRPAGQEAAVPAAGTAAVPADRPGVEMLETARAETPAEAPGPATVRPDVTPGMAGPAEEPLRKAS